MIIYRLLVSLVAAAGLAAAESQQRNPLQFLAKVESPEIQTSTHRVHSNSRFDLTFNLYKSERRLKLSLEPNHDVIPRGATVKYLNDDGSLSHSEPIDRNDHKVFKGTARVQRDDGSWVHAGWARITIHQDGPEPLFEGAFAVNHDNHHIQLSSSYTRTKHDLDPELELSDDEFMVVYRDSDISNNPKGPASTSAYAHTELRRDIDEITCFSDRLEFNSNPNHPVFRPILRRSENSWGVMPFSHLFGKRQIDSQPGGGNTGVTDLSSTIGQTAGCPSTKKVALVGVATDCKYTQTFGTSNGDARLRRNVIDVMNSASHVWETTFNISLGLKDLIISKPNCPGSPQQATPWNQDCNSGLDIQDRLNLFSQWRGDQSDDNSHWTLLTKCRTGSAVGLAWLGQSCVQSSYSTNTTGGGSETVSGANVVAMTAGTEWQVIAHETGHTFGAVHDCDSETCADTAYVRTGQCCPLTANTCDAGSRYIMNPFTTSGINTFSACTVGNICNAILQNSVDVSCLSANQNIDTITGQQCGNGIVEQGEDCDCGGEQGCQGNTCCDAQTCKFVNGAVCDDANQDCCNSCQFASKGSVCRPSSGTCDPEETCPGNAAVCPKDVIAPNGKSCSIPNAPAGAGDLACASGQCTSRDYQCQTVMGAYTQKSNDTYACDDTTCQLSCGSPVFPANTCYSLPQNMLDGTPCGGGGHCQHGQCAGSSFGEEVVSWINEHKGVVIGVAVAVGVLLLVLIASCICGCVRRRKRQQQLAKNPPAPPAVWYGPPPMPPPHMSPAWQGPPPPPESMPPRSPPPGVPSPGAGSTWSGSNNSQPWRHEAGVGWRPPQSPAPAQRGLYGNGIIGSQMPSPQHPSPFPTQPQPGYFGNFGGPSSPRYA